RSKGAFHLIRSLSAGEIPSLLWESPSFCLLALASWHLQVLGLRAWFRQLDAEKRCLIELLAPPFGGLYSPGGLFSPVMSYLHVWEELQQARTVVTLPVPSGRFRTHLFPTAVKHSCQDVFYFFSDG